MDVIFEPVNTEQDLPSKGSKSAAGLDCRCPKHTTLYARQPQLVGLGFKVEIPEGYLGLLVPRSGTAKRGITIVNTPGIIDSDYRGEVKANLVYSPPADGPDFAIVEEGERCCQLVIIPHPDVTPTFGKVGSTERGEGGFGSTGKL